ncbi:MAG: UDP-galactopyranose mutase [Clostridia bacterium]|nr:UDP-galactopyranose mutase [Clostridia bacterium]
MKYKYVVVGAGLAGLTIAERIATQLHEKVLIIEKRNHIGGNVYDEYNDDGILVQKYGPHTFHTDDKEIFDFVCKYSKWHEYQHRVLSYVDGNFVPMPISLETINKLYNMNLSEDEMESFIESKRIIIDKIETSEDVVLSQGGTDIYEKFFKYFTIKQWGVSPAELDKSVISRIPFRKNRDTRYFTDKYQGNPYGGFTKMCEKMIDYPQISVMLNTDYKEVISDIEYEKMIYTGPIDYYFNYEYGKLKWRSIKFIFETHDCESYQPVASTRWPKDYDYTRITEFKKMTGQKHDKTTILKEIPCDGEEPFYTFPTEEWKNLAQKYRDKAGKEKNVIFLGRLAEYKYYDMDDVIRRAFDVFNDIADDQRGNHYE